MPHKAVLSAPPRRNSCLFSLHMNRSKDLRTEKLKGEFFSPARGRGRALRQNLNSFKINWTQFKLCFNKFRSSLNSWQIFSYFSHKHQSPSPSCLWHPPMTHPLSPDLLKSQPLSKLLPEDPGPTQDSDAIIIIQNVLRTAVSKP